MLSAAHTLRALRTLLWRLTFSPARSNQGETVETDIPIDYDLREMRAAEAFRFFQAHPGGYLEGTVYILENE